MKHYVLHVLIIVSLFACSDKVINEQSVSQELPVSQVDNDIIQSIKRQIDETFADQNMPEGHLYYTITDINSYIIRSIPYYNLDIDRFYKDPSPNKLIECLYRPEDEKWFVGYKTDTILLTTRKYTDKWYMHVLIRDWTKLNKWLPKILDAAGTKNYKYFKLGAMEYVTLMKNNTPVFYSYDGTEEISAEKFCEKTVDYMNRLKKREATKSRTTVDIEKRKKDLEDLVKLINEHK